MYCDCAVYIVCRNIRTYPATEVTRRDTAMQQDAILMQHDANPSARPEQPPDSTSYINRVGIRVPTFWPEKPAVWFALLEGQLALSNITHVSTVFYYLISQMDNKYAAEVEDVITNPPHPQAATPGLKRN